MKGRYFLRANSSVFLNLATNWRGGPAVAHRRIARVREKSRVKVINLTPEMGEDKFYEGHRQEQPEEFLGLTRLRRCARSAAQLVRRGRQGDLGVSAGR